MKRSSTQALLLVLLAVLLIGTALHRPVAAARTQRCPPHCDLKLEKGPWVYSGDKVVVAVCIKAGARTFFFQENGTDGCYTVTGVGTNNVGVLGGGTGPACKEINHVCFYFSRDGGPGIG